jgi:hypothetical protein
LLGIFSVEALQEAINNLVLTVDDVSLLLNHRVLLLKRLLDRFELTDKRRQ